MERKGSEKKITQQTLYTTAFNLDSKKISLRFIRTQYKLMLRRLLKKGNVEPDLVKDDKDKTN